MAEDKFNADEWPFINKDSEPQVPEQPDLPPPPARSAYEPPVAHQPNLPPHPARSAYEPPVAHQPPPIQPREQSSGQPPAPPAGWQPPPPPPKKSRKKFWTILLGILAVMALAVGSCTVWFISTVTAPVDEANLFLAEVDELDFDSALAMMTTACDGSVLTTDDFKRVLGGAPIDYNINSSSITNSNATVSGSFSSENPQVQATRIEVFLRNRDGWKVCGFRVS